MKNIIIKENKEKWQIMKEKQIIFMGEGQQVPQAAPELALLHLPEAAAPLWLEPGQV